MLGVSRDLGLLSVVAPLYDEEGTVDAFYARVVGALDGIELELVLVDDGSRDGTREALERIAAADDRVKLVALSRNFGHQAALTAGLEHARGDVVVMLDADLQDPPEVIVEMLGEWRAGADVVYAVRASRAGESRLKLVSANWFYRVFARLTHMELEPNSGDFRLMDRRALRALLAMPERNRFLRGMTVWVGFRQSAVRYARDARHAGETKFSLRQMLHFSLDAISSFSHAPLQAATVIGFLCALLAFLCIPLTVVARYTNQFVPGVSSTLIAVFLLGGIQLMTVGLIGEYVGRIYDEVKRRPLYVVDELHNLDGPSEDALPVRDADLHAGR